MYFAKLISDTGTRNLSLLRNKLKRIARFEQTWNSSEPCKTFGLHRESSSGSWLGIQCCPTPAVGK